MRKSASIIHIPQPCHERWEAMTPETNGRFCDACEKVVVDFTGKTDLEIQAILRENTGKRTCGRFKTNQVGRPLNITTDSEAIRSRAHPRLVFIAALLLVFGTTLFSCYDHPNKSTMTMGIPLMDLQNLESSMTIEEPKDTVTEYFDLLGEVEVEAPSPDAPCTISTVNNSIAKPENNFNDTVLWERVEVGQYTTGMMEAYYVHDELAPPVNEQVPDSIKQLVVTHDENRVPDNKDLTEGAELSVYPNPSNGEFFVRYTVKDRCDVLLELIDLQGKTLMQVVDIKSQHNGEYNIPVDLSSFSPNLYLLRLRLGEKVVTSRVVVQR